MSDATLTTPGCAALAQATWLDEALAQREWRRTRRQVAAGRWTALFTLLVLGFWLPALTTGSYAGSTVSTWRWPFASLSIAVCLCGLGAAFLRASQLWNVEAHSHTLETWLISLQRAEPLAVTAVLSAVLPTVLMALPSLAILILTALRTDVAVGVLLEVLALFFITVAAGASAGSAVFFLQAKAWPRRMALLGAVAFAMLVALLWLRIEHVESGWSGSWERHPGRFLTALVLLTPVPHLMGLAAPDLWQTSILPRLGYPLGPEITTALLGLLYLGAAAYGIALSCQGFRVLREDPERLEQRAEAAEPAAEPGSEHYWSGFRNPIWTREIRTRLRSREAVECLFLSSLAIAVAGFFPLLTAGTQLSDPLQTAAVARQVFHLLAITLGAFVALVTPGLTAEAITMERERGTLDLLLCSPMRPREILHGKLLGAVSILALLLSPSLPLFGLCTVFHGASVSQVIGIYLALGVLLAGCAYFGVTASAMYRQMIYAKIQAYVLSLLFGTVVLWFVSLILATSERRGLIPFVSVLLPLAATLFLFVTAILWGHATERLQNSEAEAP